MQQRNGIERTVSSLSLKLTSLETCNLFQPKSSYLLSPTLLGYVYPSSILFPLWTYITSRCSNLKTATVFFHEFYFEKCKLRTCDQREYGQFWAHFSPARLEMECKKWWQEGINIGIACCPISKGGEILNNRQRGITTFVISTHFRTSSIQNPNSLSDNFGWNLVRRRCQHTKGIVIAIYQRRLYLPHSVCSFQGTWDAANVQLSLYIPNSSINTWVGR